MRTADQDKADAGHPAQYRSDAPGPGSQTPYLTHQSMPQKLSQLRVSGAADDIHIVA
jgi:hypothetical protein